MDLVKARRLLLKIQAFIDNGNGHELSRLEKDLMKSYVLQLYDAIVSEESEHLKESNKPAEPAPPKQKKHEPFTRADIPVSFVEEQPKPESKAEPRPEPGVDAITHTPEKEKPVPPPVHEPPLREKPAVAQKGEENIMTSAQKPHAPVHEAVNVHAHASKSTTSADQGDVLQNLFDLDKPDESGSRFSHVPIASIESAMGLNERIFTLNELFGGDKALFDAWCDKLNKLHSFAEAKEVLISGPATDFKWSDPERVKMAQQFIRIVSRRYPKTLS